MSEGSEIIMSISGAWNDWHYSVYHKKKYFDGWILFLMMIIIRDLSWNEICHNETGRELSRERILVKLEFYSESWKECYIKTFETGVRKGKNIKSL